MFKMLIIMIMTNYKRKNGSSSTEKILKNCVTKYYRKYSNNLIRNSNNTQNHSDFYPNIRGIYP